MARVRRRGAGFTLVELMIVVAIIAILAGIAIPAFSKYVKRSRTAEVPEYIHKIWTGAVAYYETDHSDSAGTTITPQFPDSTTKEKNCCSYLPQQICDGSAPQYSTREWQALGFGIGGPHFYRPDFFSAGIGTSATFTTEVYGDLDCDGIFSTFKRSAAIDTVERSVKASGATHAIFELE